jgi:hypothetical protein
MTKKSLLASTVMVGALVAVGLVVGSTLMAVPAKAAPIYVCTYNPHPNTIWISLRYPNGGISNFQLPSGQSDRRQGDSAGTLCSDSTPFYPPACPNATSQARFSCQ